MTLVKKFFEGNYDPFKRFVEKYDAFQDFTFSIRHSYIVCDALFPNSKFILTIRDPETWFESGCNYNAKSFYGVDDIGKLTEEDIKTKFKLYDGYVYENIKIRLPTVENGNIVVRWDLLFNYYIRQYKQRIDDIIMYFVNRDNYFLIIDVTEENTTIKITKFLEIPDQYSIDMPHRNKS